VKYTFKHVYSIALTLVMVFSRSFKAEISIFIFVEVLIFYTDCVVQAANTSKPVTYAAFKSSRISY